MIARIKLSDIAIDEGVSRTIDTSHASLIIKNMNKTKAKLSKLSKFSFPYTFEFSTPKGRKVIHNLIRDKGEYCSVTVAERLAQLESPENDTWHKVIKKWKDDIAKGVRPKPSRKLRVQFANVKIKDITIDDDIQRDMDPKWVASIANPKTFEVDYMSTIQCIYDPKKKKFISINAQHTVVLEAAFTHHGLWKEKEFNVDPMELEVPVAFIKTSNRAKARMAFRIYNGKGQKKIEPYVDHKNLVFAYRVDGSDDIEAVQAATIQTINEEEGFEPIATTDTKHKGEPWAITCIAEMQQHYKKPDRWRFVLNTHNRYYPNIQLDIMECDLYGFMYDFFTDLGHDVYSKKFRDEFLDPTQALIQEFFQTPHNFGSDSKHTQIRFQAKRYNRAINSSDNKVEDEGSFIYLLKLYQYFGGQHELPIIVHNMNEAPAGDLLDHVDKQTLLEAMKNHGKS
jgi:hypothetical protein